MPTYTCSAAAGTITQSQKSEIAAAITRAHADITGAPKHFAQVVFNQIDEGDHFIGGRPLAHDHVFVYGRIRAGRSAVSRRELIERLVSDISQILRYDPFSIWVYILELPAAALAEFGTILPEPGDEGRWTLDLPPELRIRMEHVGETA